MSDYYKAAYEEAIANANRYRDHMRYWRKECEYEERRADDEKERRIHAENDIKEYMNRCDDLSDELETANDRIAELETANEAILADIRNMKAAHESKSVFLAQLERFGYVLTAIGQTEKEARDAVINRYTLSYMDIHGKDPKDDKYDDERSYLALANEEICIMEMHYGDVEWM